MSQELLILTATAASIGFLHTILGPDHYLPFIVMGRARKWSTAKTVWITLLCGAGHVGSSVILGLAGIALGIAVTSIETVESFRGEIAAWALIAFGLVYSVWGMRKAARSRPHCHRHSHENGEAHEHRHVHFREHIHVHDEEGTRSITPWVLFTIFVLGPCEPLIPLLMYPAAKSSFAGVLGVCIVFGVTTVITMLAAVLTISLGLTTLPLGKFERYSHSMAGAAICMSGLAIVFLGL